MIIVEGTDGVGKTTLCKTLLKSLSDHVYAHFTRLPPAFDYYWGYRQRASADVVQDRFHMSELAYAKARKEPSKLCPTTYKMVDGYLRGLGCLTVLVTAGNKLVESRWTPDQMFSLEATLEANSAFMDVALGDFKLDGKSYKIDFDLHFHVHEEHPYVAGAEVDVVLERYTELREHTMSVYLRRPPSL